MRTWIIGLGLVLIASTLRGQGYPVPYYAMGSNNYHHASTVEEGAARGMADVIRSTGAANLMNSEAAINIEQARKEFIANRLRATQTYFEMKKVNKQNRYADQRRPSQADLIRYSQSKLPDRLNHAQLDPLSGAIKWPTMLRMDSMEEQRKKLEELFTTRAREGFVDPNQFVEVQDLIKSMTDEAKKVANNFPSSSRIEARKFLEGLAYEVRFQAG